MGTQVLIESTEQSQADGTQEISDQGIEPQAVFQKRWDIVEQGLRQTGTGSVDGVTVSLFHGNVLQVTAARAAIGFDSRDVAMNLAERKAPTKDR
jgi:hypothetical protein